MMTYHQISFIFQNMFFLPMCARSLSQFPLPSLPRSLPLSRALSPNLRCVAFSRRLQCSSSGLMSWSSLFGGDNNDEEEHRKMLLMFLISSMWSLSILHGLSFIKRDSTKKHNLIDYPQKIELFFTTF